MKWQRSMCIATTVLIRQFLRLHSGILVRIVDFILCRSVV